MIIEKKHDSERSLYIEEHIVDDTLYEKHMTVYYHDSLPIKATILYFHGGGLLYGNRKDLPDRHLKSLTKAGYQILCFDYPLSPNQKIDVILEDIVTSINVYTENCAEYRSEFLPYFLWGRSAGAYLCLLAAAKGKLIRRPAGILSYYGYGFLIDSWYQTPSDFYSMLPKIPESCLSNVPDVPHAEGDLDTHYSVYVYARQTGKWKDLFFEGRDKFFYLDYSLRLCDKLPCPLFCTHSMNDTDVPYQEYLELCKKFAPQRFVVSKKLHDFDRMQDDPVTIQLLSKSIAFLDDNLDLYKAHEKL